MNKLNITATACLAVATIGLGAWSAGLVNERADLTAERERIAAIEPTVVTERVEIPLTLEPCPTEDSENCRWDAAEQGNGEGRSFIAWEGKYYYLEGQDYVRIGETTIEGHYSTIGDGEAYVLYCEAPLTIGTDVDDEGNEWAACM